MAEASVDDVGRAGMQLLVISPEGEDPREHACLGGLLKAGLERYHVRKPGWSISRLEAWVASLPVGARERIVLHQHHELVGRYSLAGRHWRDDGDAPARPDGQGGITSRSCHDIATAQAALGAYDAVLLGPVFPSISKPGHGGGRTEHDVEAELAKVRSVLTARGAVARRTAVFALGGVTAGRLARCRAAGFDGVAVLGAVWNAADPVDAFGELREGAGFHA